MDSKQIIVKICGTRTVEGAVAAVEAGADIIGMIFAPSPRLIDIKTGQSIAQSVRVAAPSSNEQCTSTSSSKDYFVSKWQYIQNMRKQHGRPLLAGVFQNQPLDHVLEVVQQVPLDLVQLHGTEPLEMAKQIPVPVIKVFHIDDSFDQGIDDMDMLKEGYHSVILLDTKVVGTSQQGGHGVSFDWKIAKRLLADKDIPFMMAGGLTPENVKEALCVGGAWGVDVSSGVETDKVKDVAKIIAFTSNAKD